MEQITETQICKEIKQAIMQRKLRPNTQLVEDVLAESFGVSRTLIRQALRKLAYEKIVRIIPNKGSFVACPTTEEAKEIFEVRTALEIESTRRACRTLTNEHISQIATLIEEERKAALAGNRFESLQLSIDFHLKIAEFAGNSYLFRYLEELTSLVYVIVTFYGAENLFCGYEEHLEILEAIRQRNEDLAVSLMIKHFGKFDPVVFDNEPYFPIGEVFKRN